MRGFSLRRLSLVVGGLIAQFQCRLFLLVQALIFGDLVSFLVQCCVRYVLCLVALAGFFLVLLVPTIVGYGTLVGLSLVMVTLPDLRETSDIRFLDELLFLFGYPPGSGSALLRGTLFVRYCTSRFAHKVPALGLPFPCGVVLLVGGLLVRSDPSSPDPAVAVHRWGCT